MRKRTQTLAALTLLCGFLLGMQDGKVTLWRDGESRPEQIYDIRTDSLPPADRLLLRRGIRVETREDVWELLENYLP